jgi:hypothetical protein
MVTESNAGDCTPVCGPSATAIPNNVATIVPVLI